tara:strand:- start:925 stop:1329 length:405 start_codon:yes stop_codon:yes gene_type:complete
MENTADKTILVVEDERPLADAIRMKLENYGCDVTVARTVEQALNYLSELEVVDAIWLDHYLLGKKNGLDFVVELKKEGSQWAKVPIFVVSNTASADKVQSYIQLGINKYFVKANHKLENIISEVKESIDKLETE